MTDGYTWEWVSSDVAVETIDRPLKLEDAEALEAALPQLWQEAEQSGRPWGLVVDLRNAGVASEEVQDVLKRVMRAGAQAGCRDVAMVNNKVVVEMQSRRLAAEAEHTPIPMFETVEEALDSVRSRLG